MDASQAPVSSEEQLQGAFKLLLRLNVISLAIWAIGAAGVLYGLTLSYGNGIFDPTAIGPFYLLALPGVIYFWRASAVIAGVTDLGEQLKRYDKLRGPLQASNLFVTIGAIAMIPGAFILIQMPPVGWAILFNLYSGAILGLGYKRVHQIVSYYRTLPNASVTLDQPVEQANPYKTSAPLPPDEKRPIAQGVVWGGGLILLAINIMFELSAYSAIRNHGMANGALGDYGAQLQLVLTQFIDIFVLSLFGAILLVLAIINLTRVREKGPAMIAIAILIAGLALFPGGVSSVLAGAAGPSESLVKTQTEGRESTETIRAIMNAGPVPGFEGVYEEFYDCVPEGCSDSLMRLANEVGPESLAAEYCDNLIGFAAGVGLTEYAIAPDYESRSLEAVEARSDCVTTLDDIKLAAVQQYQAYSDAFVMEGTASVGANAPVRFVLTQAIDGNLDDNPGYHTFFLEISTTFTTGAYSTPGGGLSVGTVEINDLLDLIGQQRLANPDRAPMDRAFVEEILADYPHSIEMTLVENASGEIHRIHLTTSDGAEMCLSIEPWESDPFNEGIPDPGMGYGLGYMESLDVLRGFGNAVEGSCG